MISNLRYLKPRACLRPHFRCAHQQRTTESRGACARASKESQASTIPSTATDAVESGDAKFNDKEYAAALQLYEKAMQLRPNDDEARAAQYNAACAHTKLKQWNSAVECLKKAVNDYNLKVSVIYKDNDLTSLRERREWLDVRDDLTGTVASSTRTTLRAEAKAPFRLARITITGGLLAGAALGLAVITTKLIAIAGGAPNAPDLQETLQNFGINIAALTILGFVLRRDLQGKSSDEANVVREEELGRLQVQLSQGRVLPLARLRGTVRPLILAGSKGYVNKCLREVKRFKPSLLDRGVSLLPIVLSDDDPDSKLKALKKDPAFASAARGFASTSNDSAAPPAAKGGGGSKGGNDKWMLTASAIGEWVAWLNAQKAYRGLNAENFYIQVQLDGSVRMSGIEVPPFPKLIDDIPELGSIRSSFTDGIGPQED